MSLTNVLGIRNSNTIIPYTGTTKSTKQLSLVKTTDITVAVTGGDALAAGYTVTTAVRFYADSAGTWKMNIQGEIGSGGSTSNRTGIVITFVKSSVKFVTTMQGAGVAYVGVGGGVISYVYGVKNTNTLEIDHATGTASNWFFSGDFVLAQEPTDYTTIAANMEGVAAVDVFVPNASTTPGLLSYYATGSVAANGDYTGTVYYTRIGNVVTVTSTNLTHGTGSQKGSSAGLIPVGFRPPIAMATVYYQSGSRSNLCSVLADGQITTQYLDWAGSLINGTETSAGINITYMV